MATYIRLGFKVEAHLLILKNAGYHLSEFCHLRKVDKAILVVSLGLHFNSVDDIEIGSNVWQNRWEFPAGKKMHEINVCLFVCLFCYVVVDYLKHNNCYNLSIPIALTRNTYFVLVSVS